MPGSWRIVKAAVAPTPPDAVRDGIVIDQAGDRRRPARPCCQSSRHGRERRRLPPSAGLQRDCPPYQAADYGRKRPPASSIRFEAAKHISSSVEDSMIEFEITGPVPGEDDKMNVMLVAAPNDMVESRLSALIQAGLEPVAVDIEAFALQRALVDLSPTRPGEGATLALLDIGATTTDVNIIANGLFALTRNVPIAGDSFTQALKSIAPGAGWTELEQMKTEVDMAALLQGDGSDSEAAALARTLQPAIDELLREVRRSTNYYQSQLADPANSILPAGTTSQTSGPVSKIVITGGSAKMRGLEAYMSARLGVPVEVWNPFQNPELESGLLLQSFTDENHPLLVTGIGLALKELARPSAQTSKASSKRNPAGKSRLTILLRSFSKSSEICLMPSINMIALRREEKRQQEKNARKLLYAIAGEVGTVARRGVCLDCSDCRHAKPYQ